MAESATSPPRAIVARMVGASATRAVELLPELLPDVARYTFLRYTPAADVDQRIRRNAGNELRAELARLEAATPHLVERIVGLPGLISAFNDPTSATLAEMLRHDDVGETSGEFGIDASTLLRTGLASTISVLAQDQALGLCSSVVLNDGQSAHLPLLDLSLPPSPENCVLVKKAAQLLRMPHALILESGRSYHLYGLSALTHDAWVKFLARALLLAPMVDVRYVAHRLLSAHSVLRINATASKPVEPHVVAAF